MKYYVTSDIHGYFSELKSALAEKGFFSETSEHKLIICGDLFDRGSEAQKLQEFILSLIEKDEVILIRGNHEDLLVQLLNDWNQHSYNAQHHISNMTVDTVLQLTRCSKSDLLINADAVKIKMLHSPCIRKIIPSMLNYYETEHYIFVHGWIPSSQIRISAYKKHFNLIDDWRNANSALWNAARWLNGMEAAHEGIIIPGKTIVCGHWHCSFGHARYERKGGEFDNNPVFTPYIAEGIIALDACTVKSGFVNCIVIEDDVV